MQAWQDKLTADGLEKIEALLTPLKTEVDKLTTEIDKLKTDAENLQKENAATHDTIQGANTASNSITCVIEFQKGEVDGLIAWLKKGKWHIEKLEPKPTGDGTIIATKPIEPTSPKSPPVQPAPVCWTSVPMTQYACPPVYVIPARKHVLKGCCR